jgi:hypothetical protein
MSGDVFHVVIMRHARRELAASFAVYSAKLARSLFAPRSGYPMKV